MKENKEFLKNSIEIKITQKKNNQKAKGEGGLERIDEKEMFV